MLFHDLVQAYRLEPLISSEYSNIAPLQLHRFDSKQSGYSEAKPSKTGTGSKWGFLRVGFSKNKADEEASERSASPNSEENMEDSDEVVIVHNAASTESSAGRSCSRKVLKKSCVHAMKIKNVLS